MTVNDIIKAQEICFIRQENAECGYCKECPVMKLTTTENCQKFLAENTVKKLKELTSLIDDNINHHYYDTLEYYQEQNSNLIDKLDSILSIIKE